MDSAKIPGLLAYFVLKYTGQTVAAENILWPFFTLTAEMMLLLDAT